MIHRNLRKLSALLIVSAALPALSQVVPQARGRVTDLPLRVGVGYSNYASAWRGTCALGNARCLGGYIGGPTVWIDFSPPKLPRSLSGFQIEAEARDLNYDRTGTDPNLRQYTFAGGLNYAWRYDPAFHPYIKFLTGVGNLEFYEDHQYYGQGKLSGTFKDSRAFYAPAGGLEVRLHERLWLRGNYEYQFWPNFFHTLSPHGFTVGIFYDFSKLALEQYQP